MAKPLPDAVAENATLDDIKLALEAPHTDVDALGKQRASALLIAAGFGRVDVCEALLEAGANPNLPSGVNGATPLHRAARRGSLALCRLLAASGADLNCVEADGSTPLHSACSGAHAVLAAWLSSAGADMRKNTFGYYPPYVVPGTADDATNNIMFALMQPQVVAAIRRGPVTTLNAPGATVEAFNALLAGGPPPSLPQAAAVLQGLARSLATNVRIKLILAGFKEQGKTSFVRALRGLTPVEDAGEAGRTRGMDIVTLRGVQRVDDTGEPLPPCVVRLFDFGGHVEYASLQSHFLSPDAVFVITVSLKAVRRDEVEARRWVDTWLQAARCRHGSRQSVALLGTHLDCVEDAEALLTAVTAPHEADGESPFSGVAAVSNVTNATLVREADGRTFRRHGGGKYKGQPGVATVLEAMLVAASRRLEDVLDAPLPHDWIDLVEAFDSGGSHALFHGRYFLSWDTFEDKLVGRMGSRGAVLQFAEHAHAVGALVQYYSPTTSAPLPTAPEREVLPPGPPWVHTDDDCWLCEKRFRWWRRRHHCRLCHRSFCDTHSGHRAAVDGYPGAEQRVCHACAMVINFKADVAPPRPDAPDGPEDVPALVVVDPQCLVDAMKSVVAHSYVGIKHHDGASEAALHGKDCPAKALYTEAQANMRAVAEAAVDSATSTYASIEEVCDEEQQYVEKGRLTRRFLYDVLWGETRRVGHPGQLLFTAVTDTLKHALTNLMCQFEHVVVVSKGGYPTTPDPHPKDVLLVPYLRTLLDVKLSGVDVRLAQHPLPSTARPVGAVIRTCFQLPFMPQELFSRVVANLYSDHTFTVDNYTRGRLWLKAPAPTMGATVTENVLVLHDGVLAGAEAGAGGPPPAPTHAIGGSIRVVGWYDGEYDPAVARLVCRGGNTESKHDEWREEVPFRFVQCSVEAAIRRLVDTFEELACAEFAELDGDPSVRLLRSEVGGDVFGVCDGNPVLHLIAPDLGAAVSGMSPGWMCGCEVTPRGLLKAAEEGDDDMRLPAVETSVPEPDRAVLRCTVPAGKQHPAPPFWLETDAPRAAVVPLTPGCAEHTSVVSMLHESLPTANVVAVQRVQNVHQFRRFQGEWVEVQHLGVPPNERLLWHGTSGLDPMDVCTDLQTGLDVRFSGTNPRWFETIVPTWVQVACGGGAAFGKALYFAESAAYSDRVYAYKGATVRGLRVRQLLLVRVICGDMYDFGEERRPDLIRPTAGDQGRRYNSLRGGPFTNKATGGPPAPSHIVCVFNNPQTYPAYLVSYETE